jgi:pantoate--beta-alanine ligase
LIPSRSALRESLAPIHRQGKRVGLVPTMGALHDGHLSLVDAARAECDFTVVTIYVNPTQFGPNEDLASYPRTLEADLRALARRQVDLVFAPCDAEMYRPGHETFVEVGSTAKPFEGQLRPGHFRGVATIVLKLLNLVVPHSAYFGRKDYQQLLVIRQLVDDLDLPVAIRDCPTVREPDGLAMSSRNAYLSPEQRRRARALPESLHRAAELVASGQRDAAVIQRQVREQIREGAGVEPQYVALVKEGTVAPVTRLEGPTVVAVAAVIGQTRLIDNALVG